MRPFTCACGVEGSQLGGVTQIREPRRVRCLTCRTGSHNRFKTQLRSAKHRSLPSPHLQCGGLSLPRLDRGPSLYVVQVPVMPKFGNLFVAELFFRHYYCLLRIVFVFSSLFHCHSASSFFPPSLPILSAMFSSALPHRRWSAAIRLFPAKATSSGEAERNERAHIAAATPAAASIATAATPAATASNRARKSTFATAGVKAKAAQHMLTKPVALPQAKAQEEGAARP